MPYVVAILLVTANPALAAPKPVPKSPYLGVVYRYADARLAHGRDTYGSQKTGLFLSALDRKTLAPLKDRPTAPAGIEESRRAASKDGPLVGANPQHDQNFLRVLYTLSELSFTPKYRDAADAELKWFLENSDSARIAPWDAGVAWNVMSDTQIAPVISSDARPRVWMLWDRCFELSPAVSKRLVHGLRGTEPVSLRRTGGYSIRALAVAHHHTKDESLVKGIKVALAQLEERFGRELSVDAVATADWLVVAVDCGGAVSRVPEPLASRLRKLVVRADREFCGKEHDFSGRHVALEPSVRWPGVGTLGMLCVSRYENTGNVGYRKLILEAASVYRDTPPPADADLWPMVFGHAISLELAAWRSTANQEYLDSAIKLADFAVKHFWDDSPLPRASLKTQHFESITGADTLALALVELHLSILHITAVRSPPNTIDR